MAELASFAAREHGERTAVRFKRDDGRRELTFAQVAEVVDEIALGLIATGIGVGDRVCLLADTRPEWAYVSLAISGAGAVVVPIYPTNSPEECEWVAGNSDARAVVCENADQLAKIEQVRGALPALETVVAIEPAVDGGDAIGLDALRERGRGGDRGELDRRRGAVRGDDPYTIIYTSGTTGPPKGCVLTHANGAAVCSVVEELDFVGPDDVSYLYLPLAHVFALAVLLASFDVGGTLVFFGGDPKQIVPELQDARPTYFPSVPRIFEKIHAMATGAVAQASPEDQERFSGAIEVGLEVRRLRQAGEPVPGELEAAFDQAEERLYRNVRALFGGSVRQAVTGAAPIAREILEFFHACGVPVLEGWGMTETTGVGTVNTLEEFKLGTVGRALPGVEIAIADDGEVLMKGPNVFSGYHGNPEATAETIVDGWLRTGDLGALDEDGFLSITGRKKDIIITAGGKNLTPANLENDLKQSRWISQAVMHGDRRPYPVALITLDADEVLPWAREHGLDADIAALAHDERVRELIQADLDRVNARHAKVAQIKKFTVLDHDLSQETGELTPTLKVKRNVVNEKYADLFEAMY